ncbi:hypothetical protein BY458DRAFT_536643 [Sporodiniella umbellata]|nr:hypothetical protein BY458DRAFT_536643 [Sporodiniella umbellata]
MVVARQQVCYTHGIPNRMIEFRPQARLVAHRFESKEISVQIVLDEAEELRPPQVTIRRLSRLSLSAIEPEDTPSIPIMQYIPRSTIAYSTSPTHISRRNSLNDYGCLVGSFEESLFSGRMSSQPSKPITFHCQLGVLGFDCKPHLKCPPHLQSVFPATFYDLQEDQSTPYVGTVDLLDPGYRIPPKGQIQVVIKNPNKTAVKLFLIPYDFKDMPKNSKTFLRQKSYALHTHLLRYAIHLHICRVGKRLYIYRSIRIVFANRVADGREKFKVTCEGPKEPVYVPL